MAPVTKTCGVFLFKPQVIFKKVMTFEVEVIYGSEIEITASQKKKHFWHLVNLISVYSKLWTELLMPAKRQVWVLKFYS